MKRIIRLITENKIAYGYYWAYGEAMEKFKALSLGKRIGIALTSVLAVGAVAGASSSTTPKNPQVLPEQGQTQQLPKDNVETKSVSITEVIPFESTTQNDASLTAGATKVSVPGVAGERTITFKVTYKNGIEVSREQSSSQITKQPVTQVTLNGTYVAPQLNCPNGTYINSAGNEVCSPYSASSAPAGATARCGDGTYSFSQSRSGTCSHHSGVAQWL